VQSVDSSLFSDFTVASSGSSTTLFYGGDFGFDWPYAYVFKNTDVWRIDLPGANAGSGIACEATAFGGSASSMPYVQDGHPYGYYIQFVSGTSNRVYRWTRASEPSAMPHAFFTANIEIYSFRINQDEDRIFVYGYHTASDRMVLQVRDIDGILIDEFVIAVGSTSGGGMVAHPTHGAIIIVNDDPIPGDMSWKHVSETGTITDITGSVSVDGTGWDTFPGLQEEDWGKPLIYLTQVGSRIGWGGTYNYGLGVGYNNAFHGVITGGSCGGGWWVGEDSVGWTTTIDPGES
jgi:hypothetical protein